MARKTDEIDQMKATLVGLFKQVGKYHGRRLLVEKTIAGRYVCARYLVFYDREPLRFTFEFYKPENTWRGHMLSCDEHYRAEVHLGTSMDTLLEDK